MTLTIEQRERESVVILDLNGPLVLGDQKPDLRESLRLLREAGVEKVALNMENVSRIDSTGLGTLVFAHVKLHKASGRLTLFHLNPSHLNLLLLTKLVTVFELFEDEQNAIDSYFPDRATQRYDILSFVEKENELDALMAE